MFVHPHTTIQWSLIIHSCNCEPKRNLPRGFILDTKLLLVTKNGPVYVFCCCLFLFSCYTKNLVEAKIFELSQGPRDLWSQRWRVILSRVLACIRRLYWMRLSFWSKRGYLTLSVHIWICSYKPRCIHMAPFFWVMSLEGEKNLPQQETTCAGAGQGGLGGRSWAL